MPTQTLTRAWTDLDFRASLTPEDLGLVDHPAGDIDEELNQLDLRFPPVTSDCSCITPIPWHLCCV
jgi:hypothetical protein